MFEAVARDFADVVVVVLGAVVLLRTLAEQLPYPAGRRGDLALGELVGFEKPPASTEDRMINVLRNYS